MPIYLETTRLILKQFCDEDGPSLFKLNSDPDVVKYTGEPAYKSIDDVQAGLIRNYYQYEHYKSGRLSVFDKQTGEYIGWCGLRYFPDSKQTDLGYRLFKRHWGKGYATESSIACLNYGFNTLNLEKIIATAMVENTASINVFKKLGMKFSHYDEYHDAPAVVYAILKEEWK
jgi:ribosomal-protein-alanine N-acetyltransferase